MTSISLIKTQTIWDFSHQEIKLKRFLLLKRLLLIKIFKVSLIMRILIRNK